MIDPSTVRVVRTEDFDETARAEIVVLCVAAHHNEEFEHLFTYVGGGGLHFLADRDGELVSHAVVTTRWLQPAGQPLLDTAYVDAEQFRIACLETDRETFYARLGWQVWRGPLAGRGDDGLVPTPVQTGVMVLPLSRTPALDLDAALTIECQPARIW